MALPQLLASFSTMTVTQLNEKTEKLHKNKDGISMDISWELWFTGEFSSVALAVGAPLVGLPIYGELIDFAGSFTFSYVSDISVDLAPAATPNPALISTNQPSICIYTAKFSPITAERLDLSPLSRPPIITGGGSDLTEVRNYDQKGNPLINSAGDAFENPPAQPIAGGDVVITRNEPSNPAMNAATFSNTLNTNAFYGIPALAGLMGIIRYQEVIENYNGTSIEYYRVAYPIRYRTDTNGWFWPPLDYGWRFKQSGTLVTIGSAQDTTSKSNGIHQPLFLDGSGNLLNGDGTGSNAVVFPAASGGGFAGYQITPDKDWGSLSLPNPFD